MDCAEEVSLLRRALSKKAGIRELHFDVFQARMQVEFDPARLGEADIEAAVAATGMRCEPWQDEPRAPRGLWERHGRRILTCVSGATLLAGMVWQGVSSGELMESLLAHQHDHEHHLPAGVRLLFFIAIATGAIHAMPKAWTALRALRPDMNLLVVLSLIGASALGEWTEAATLSFLFSLAVWLEGWSMRRAREAIAKLMQVAPLTASVVHGEGEGEHEHTVPVAQVEVGARIRVKPGERIACDGEVVRGESLVNQALITGESVAVEKGPGDGVYAGTMNEDGMLEIRVTRAAEESTLARMIRMVEESQARRAPSEQFVEKFTRYYTPAVFFLAFSVMVLPPLAGAGAWSEWFYQGMVVLLIACPCALVISTPVSVVASLTSAARLGVLVKGGAFLEEAARIRAVALDKTGILTSGRPEVREMVTFNGEPAAGVLARLVSLEQASEHPLARAILRYGAALGVSGTAPESFRSLRGRGAEAQIEGGTFWAGGARLLLEKGLAAPRMLEQIEHLSGGARSVVVCGLESEPLAVLALADPVRPEARWTVDELKRLGIGRIVMLTGDNEATAREVAREVGIEDVRAGLLPDEKAGAVDELLAGSRHVAMVGDGVNDAQALSRASLGITLGRQGTDVARESADVVFMSNDLTRLPFLIRHARRTVCVIKQNITLALVLKAGFLVAAMAGVATLWMAVLADMGATFLVTFNGLRLLHPAGANRGPASGHQR
jgi:Zn2+/Cd2+-exporting ATPase